MRYFVSLFIINVALILSVFFKLNQEEVKAITVPNVCGMSLNSAREKLSDFIIQVNYVEDNTKIDTVISSSPRENSLVHYGQVVVLNVSKGYVKEKYQNLVGTLYQDNINYLNELQKAYQLKVIINYQDGYNYVDGLIINMNLKGEIKTDDVLELVIARNPKTIMMPDFTGRYYQEVLAFGKKYGIEIKFFYVEGFLASDLVISQSIKPNTPVLKNGCYLEIYLQE